MFAGKTSELLRRVHQHEVQPPSSNAFLLKMCPTVLNGVHDGSACAPQAAGRKVAVVKSSVDNRYHATRVVSHDGHSKVCACFHLVSRHGGPYSHGGPEKFILTFFTACMQACFAASSLGELRQHLGDRYHEYNVIAIDEAQFLPDLLEFCTTAADIDHKHIVVAGLDGDFKRQRFGQVSSATHMQMVSCFASLGTLHQICVAIKLEHRAQ